MIFAAVGGGMIIACGAFVWFILADARYRVEGEKTEYVIHHSKGQSEAVSGWPSPVLRI